MAVKYYHCQHQRQKTPTISPNDQQPAQRTDQAPGTIERAAQESRRKTPTSKAAVHVSSTATTCQHYPHTPNRLTTRSSQITQPTAKQKRAEPHYFTDTTHLSGDTQRPPPGGGGTFLGVADGATMEQLRAHGQGRREAGGTDEGGGGRAKMREWGG